MITKKTKILAALAIIVGITAAGVGVMQAATNNNCRPNFMSNIINAIAQKFNLNPTDVQQVVDEQQAQQKAQMEANRQQSFTDRINKAVTDGNLTQAQANLILAKKTELDSQKIDLQGKTKEEIQTSMKAQADALKQWATDNNIPQQYLMFGFGGGRGGFGGPGFKGHGKPATSPTP